MPRSKVHLNPRLQATQTHTVQQVLKSALQRWLLMLCHVLHTALCFAATHSPSRTNQGSKWGTC
jgi:hypothetical protein